MFLSRQNTKARLSSLSRASLTRRLSSSVYDHHSSVPPPSLSQATPGSPLRKMREPSKKKKRASFLHRYVPTLEESAAIPRLPSNLPFDFRFSYTESNPAVRPIGLREPKFSPFGPGRLDRVWTGISAPAIDPTTVSLDDDRSLAGAEAALTSSRQRLWETNQGKRLTHAERFTLVNKFKKTATRRQVNLGRDGLTHNMLLEIQCHWKNAEVVRIKCLGVPTVDMKTICSQLEDKTFGKIISRRSGILMLYRGRGYGYGYGKIPRVPLMLWKPHEPIYPRLIKTTIEGLTIEETKKMRKRGLAQPIFETLYKNGYYGSLVTMVRDGFINSELLRINCTGLHKSDYRKIGVKLRDLVPCKLVTFDKEQIVVWRGNDYNPPEVASFFSDSDVEDDSFNSVDSVNSVDSPKIQGYGLGINIQWEV